MKSPDGDGRREGLVIKDLGGFFTVWSPEETVTCKMRGRFHLDGVSPLPGDYVAYTRLTDGSGRVESILPRRNEFSRPLVANIDTLILVVSWAIPASDPFLIDRMTALAAYKGVDILICINKIDLESAEEWFDLYAGVGYRTLRLSAHTGEGIPELRAAMAGKVVAFTGNSGVGKSSILNVLRPELALRTAEVSLRGGRGRHTTRHVELIFMGDDSWAADTPGFSTFDVESMEKVEAATLRDLFPEFHPYEGNCRFTGCHHIGVAGCAVSDALADGRICASRFDSYRRLFETAKDRRPWETRSDEKRK